MLSPLRKKRILAELTIWDLAQKVEISAPKLSLIERGKSTANQKDKEGLAKALNCDIGEIFPDET